jgi:Transposase DDE domain
LREEEEVLMVSWIIEKVAQCKSRFAESVLERVSRRAVEQALAGFTRRRRVWDAWALVRTFLFQMAWGFPCREAVEGAIQQGWVPPGTSPLNPGYCKARGRLPEGPLRALALQTGRALEEEARRAERWPHRSVKVLDGTGLSLSDTPANQKAYPQPSGQKPGCGFPLMYVCALMGLAGGGILDAVTGAGAGKERVRFRTLWRSLCEGDIVLADAGFGSFAEVWALWRRGVDSVVRLGKRKAPAGRIEQLGPDDWLVEWPRPRKVGRWVERAALPARLLMRVIEFDVGRRGFRTRHVALATTLLEERLYPRHMLMGLYRRRWEMELRLRDIKTTMGLEKLRCKSPEGCRKELWMGLMAYNLIRTVMVEAARMARLKTARISFAGTLQRLRQFGTGCVLNASPRKGYRMLLEHLARDRLPVRPNRREPRAVKRRPKNYQLLTAPRHLFREIPHRHHYQAA